MAKKDIGNQAVSDTLKQAADKMRENPGETTRGVTGILLIAFALYLMVSLISFLMDGASDQSVLDNSTAMELASTDNGVRNFAGSQGAQLARLLMDRLFGLASLLIPVFLTASGLWLLRIGRIRLWKWFLSCALLMVWISVALGSLHGLYEDSFFYWGGHHGWNVSTWIASQIGTFGLVLLLVVTGILFLVAYYRGTLDLIRGFLSHGVRARRPAPGKGVTPEEFSDSWSRPDRRGRHRAEATSRSQEAAAGTDFSEDSEIMEAPGKDHPRPGRENEITFDVITPQPVDTDAVNAAASSALLPGERERRPLEDPSSEEPSEAREPEFTVSSSPDDLALEAASRPYNPRLDLENYRFPGLDLLKDYGNEAPTVNMEEQTANKNRIVETLSNFSIEISSIKATVGPTVTLYEITPAPGVRISKIRGLEDDIALSLSALGIRIIAPIPGKGTIGIEVPNNRPQIVSGQSILGSRKFQESDYELPLAIGKTISNEVFLVDLCKMPHLLVAGATGQGKSVGLNAMIMSLLYKKHPSELKLVMVDPKKVEFSIYSAIERHFLAKLEESPESIITDDKNVTRTLTSVCQEMDDRYDLLKMANVRNVKEYNEKFISRSLNPQNGHRYLPYIVVVIDEFGDLIMTAGKDIELPIARIAQKARAVGIHMIIATQRPTTNIITGTIKANFPARIAFRVSSMIDSRTILDRPGANQLIGRGDMLFSLGNDPVRVQCAFIDTPEVLEVTEFIRCQQGYVSPLILPEPREDQDGEIQENNVDMTKLDPLFEEAARLIIIHQNGSTSLIQRKFSIGYNRAGRLMDQLEKAGIVGPAQGSKPRDVYCADETDLENRLENLKK